MKKIPVAGLLLGWVSQGDKSHLSVLSKGYSRMPCVSVEEGQVEGSLPIPSMVPTSIEELNPRHNRGWGGGKIPKVTSRQTIRILSCN